MRKCLILILGLLFSSAGASGQVSERQLQAIADSYLPLFDNMPRVRVVIRHEPIGQTRKFEYVDPDGQSHIIESSESFLAYYQPAPEYADGSKAAGLESYIVLKKTYLAEGGLSDLADWKYVLKHELTHAWVDWKNLDERDPHGKVFQSKLYAVGIRARGWDVHDTWWANLEYGWRPVIIGLALPLVGFVALLLYLRLTD